MSNQVESGRPLRRGDTVEIRPVDEILATLDAGGKLQGVLFMPEMARYCGQRQRVFRRADKTCVEGVGIRRLGRAVFLEGLRCDGACHEGCQRGCLYFWHEAWLKAVPEAVTAATGAAAGEAASGGPAPAWPTRHDGRFYCQSTELLAATSQFPPLAIGHYWQDLRLGEGGLGRVARIFIRQAVNKIRRWWGMKPYGEPAGSRPGASKGDLDLQPGEWVEIKSRREILATLDPDGKNRGLSFEIEMLDHCGRRYQVAYPVRKIILEQTGVMVELAHTVVLAGVVCEGTCAKNCPRSNYFFWRESWLRRVEGPPPRPAR
jgi:hypothetical protein